MFSYVISILYEAIFSLYQVSKALLFVPTLGDKNTIRLIDIRTVLTAKARQMLPGF